MREVPLLDRSGRSPSQLSALSAAVAASRTLADVLAWARARRPAATVVEIVTQDEYTHDVVVALPGDDDALPLYVVYDTT